MKVCLRSLASVAAALVAGCSSAPSGPAAPSVAVSSTVLRVGVTPSTPPMIFKSGSQYVGVEAELAESLARDLGRKVVFVEEKWDNLIDALCDGRIDIIMSSMSITAARTYRIAFSDPYLRVSQMALARSDERYKYLSNLAGQAKNGVGVKPGTTADFMLRQEFSAVDRKYFKTGEQGAAALAKKKIDLFFGDAPMILYLAGLYETRGLGVTPMVLGQEQLGWGLRRNDDQLRQAVNAFLKKEQASGQINRTFGKWMPGFQ